MVDTVVGISSQQHDLKGRMPERSEWLVAEGYASLHPRYRATLYDAKNANITFHADNIRVFQTLFLGMSAFRGLR
ncbi:MAG: hypothetical protein PUD41_05920 [bacterium]|nr:hypothetical protein [bacterium]